MSPEDDREGGFTLIELLVVMFLFGIIGSIVSMVMIDGLKHQTSITERIVNVNDLRKVMERMTREIRNSTGRGNPTATSLAIQEPGTAGATRVLTWTLAGGAITQAEYDRSATGTVTTLPTKTLLTGVPASVTTLFTYGPRSPYSAPSTVDPTTCAIKATPTIASSGCLGLVTISLSAATVHASTPVTLTDTVELRNM